MREESAAAQKQWAAEKESDTTHTQVQGWLRDLGHALGFKVWIAANDRSREYAGGRLSDGCLAEFPATAGTGLDAEAKSRMFDPFWRGDAARSRAKGGAGLGMTIARGVIEAHGGRIWAQPRESGGACVAFTLPRAP